MNDQELDKWEREKRNCLRKFNSYFPTMDSMCVYCGKRYGDHLGTDCPPDTNSASSGKSSPSKTGASDSTPIHPDCPSDNLGKEESGE